MNPTRPCRLFRPQVDALEPRQVLAAATAVPVASLFEATAAVPLGLVQPTEVGPTQFSKVGSGSASIGKAPSPADAGDRSTAGSRPAHAILRSLSAHKADGDDGSKGGFDADAFAAAVKAATSTADKSDHARGSASRNDSDGPSSPTSRLGKAGLPGNRGGSAKTARRREKHAPQSGHDHDPNDSIRHFKNSADPKARTMHQPHNFHSGSGHQDGDDADDDKSQDDDRDNREDDPGREDEEAEDVKSSVGVTNREIGDLSWHHRLGEGHDEAQRLPDQSADVPNLTGFWNSPRGDGAVPDELD